MQALMRFSKQLHTKYTHVIVDKTTCT